MQDVDWLVYISRCVHICAVIVVIGGAAFQLLALLPALRSAPADDSAKAIGDAVRKKWARFIHVAIALLLITGGINFWRLAIPPKVDAIPYHPIFGVKLLAAMTIFFIASALVGSAPGFEKMRRNAGRWLAWVVVLALAIVFLSGLLYQIRLSQKEAPSETTSTAMLSGFQSTGGFISPPSVA